MGDIADWMVDQALRFWPRDPGPTEEKWTTGDGRRIRVRDMDNGHLLNTIRHLQRSADRELGICMAIADSEYDGYAEVFDESDLSYPAIYHDMVAEANRRGLDLSLPAYAANRIATPDEFP